MGRAAITHHEFVTFKAASLVVKRDRRWVAGAVAALKIPVVSLGRSKGIDRQGLAKLQVLASQTTVSN